MPELIVPEKSELSFLKILKKHRGYLMDSISNLDEFYRKWVLCQKRHFSLIYCSGCNDFTGYLAGAMSEEMNLPVCYISIDRAYEDGVYAGYAFKEACRLSEKYGIDKFCLYANRSVESLVKQFGMKPAECKEDEYYIVDQSIIHNADGF